MESADMSLNANAVGGFAGMDVHKKALMGDQSELESGYVSTNWSISQSQATGGSDVLGMGLSHSAKFSSSSFKRSLDLETISENAELKELQETPTTRSIRHLNAFHINTPQNTRDQLETTPKKANYFSNLHGSCTRSGSKKARSQLSNIRWSLEKSSPKLRSSVDRMKSFSSQSSMFESLDENYENVFNDDPAEHACNQSIGVSPIKPHNASSTIARLPEKPEGMQRHASGIESSTPKNNFKRIRTQSIVKPKLNLADELTRDRLIRKTQSLTPSKRSALRETNFQYSIEPSEVPIEAAPIEPKSYNPARKVLEFSTKKFEQLIHPSATITTAAQTKQTTPIKLNISRDNVTATTPKSITKQHTPLKRLNTKQSRLVKEFSRKKLTRTVTVRHTPSKVAASLNESDILAALANENENENETEAKCKTAAADTDDNLMDISDVSVSSSTKTPSIHKQRKAQAGIRSDTPIRDDFVKQNIREEANRTPAKRFQKSTSYNVLSLKSSPEKEKLDIVYGHLPCTPPKNRQQRRSLKRSAAAVRTDSPLVTNEPSAKRKLYSERTRSYYNGMEQMDILTYLQKYATNAGIVERILSHLNDENLQTASMVCKSWRNCVNENPKFKLRRRKFIRAMETTKENMVEQIDSKYISSSSSSTSLNNNTIPLHVHNKNFVALAEKPSMVSPSKRRFDEHQKIVGSLRPGQRVLYCPRCSGASVVYPATTNEAKGQRRSPRRHLQHSYSLQEMSLRSSISGGGGSKYKRNHLIAPFVISEYAACAKKTCGYEFCTNCYYDRHLNAKCTKRPLGSSPKSDDDTPYRCEPHNTKRNLRRLKRLEF